MISGAHDIRHHFKLLAVFTCIMLMPLQASRSQVKPEGRADIVFLDSQPLTLTANQDNTLHVAVRNVGTDVRRASFCTFVTGPDCTPTKIVGASNQTLTADQVTLFSLQISATDLRASGYLELQTFSENGHDRLGSNFRQFKALAPIFPTRILCLAGISAILAFVVGLVVWVRLKSQKVPMLSSWLGLKSQNIPMLSRMSSPTWDFSKSWASNITLGGAFLSGALALAGLPEETHYVSRTGYATLNLLFTLIAAIAPFVFNIFRTAIVSNPGQPTAQVEYIGYLLAFLIAGGITMFAVVSQLIVLIVVINEFLVADLISCVPALGFQTLVGTLAVGVLIYAEETLYWTAKSQSAPPPPPPTAKALNLDMTKSAVAPLPEAPPPQPEPLQHWAPL